MTEYALRLANGVDTAPRVRQADALHLYPNGSQKVRSGIRNDGGGVCTAVAGTMGVSVSPLVAFIQGGSSTSQGGYPYVLDAAKTVTLTDGHASLARVDTIAVVVQDDAFDGTGSTTATLQVITGTPGAGAPSLPASAIALRDINVPAGLSAGTGGLSSSNLGTDRRTYLPSGVLRVASATERNALSEQAGMVVYRTDTKRLEACDGTNWAQLKQDDGLLTQAGTSASFASTTANNSSDLTITFPTPYSAAPTVVAASQWQWFNVSVVSVSATQVTLRMRNFGTGTSAPTCTWIAVGAP